MEQRTEEEWRRLHETAICAILTGRCANPYFGDMSMNTLVSEAIWSADDLIDKLRKREEKYATPRQ